MSPGPPLRLSGAVWLVQAAALGIVALLTACGSSGPPAPRELTLLTADGWHLPARLYLPTAELPPGIVCLHGYGAGHERWEQFADRACALGYAVIAIDLRAHGTSRRTDGPTPGYRELNAHGWKAAVADVRAAKQSLLEAGADPAGLALAGEGLGADIALHYATLDDAVQALVLASPRMEAGGIDAVEAMGGVTPRPVLLIGAEDDAAAQETVTALDQRASGFCEVRIYPGTADGTALFAVNVNALELTLKWLMTILPPAPASE